VTGYGVIISPVVGPGQLGHGRKRLVSVASPIVVAASSASSPRRPRTGGHDTSTGGKPPKHGPDSGRKTGRQHQAGRLTPRRHGTSDVAGAVRHRPQQRPPEAPAHGWRATPEGTTRKVHPDVRCATSAVRLPRSRHGRTLRDARRKKGDTH
jgi:hypothetical protein